MTLHLLGPADLADDDRCSTCAQHVDACADRGCLVTPTGVALGWFEPNTTDWYTARRAGIGSSDIPALVGSSSYRTKLEVFLDKRGELPAEDLGEAGQWGHLLEDIVATEWARRAGLPALAVRVAPSLAHVEHPWRRANLDRLVAGCTHRAGALDPDDDGADEDAIRCAVEVKTRNAWAAGSWRDDIPDDVLAQVQWQLHVTGLDHIHVACLIGGQRLVAFTIAPDPAVIDYLVGEACAMWEAIGAGVMPAVDPSALLTDLLDRLHPNRDGVVEVAYLSAARIAADYRAAAAAEKAAEAAKEAAKAEMVTLLAGGDRAAAAGKLLCTYKPDLRRSCDFDALQAGYPHVYEAVVTRKPTKPILRWNSKEI